MVIAIDGPAGSGKTTIAKLLAKKLDLAYLDTGATYRALTLSALEENLDLADEQSLVSLAKNLDLRIKDGNIYLNKRNVSEEIRTPRIDKNISLIVSHPKVREVMVKLQREMSQGKNCVVEGRDITTVVFPNAEYKFYLDADFSIRAKRRFNELSDKEINIDFGELKKDLEKRDDADKNRKIGPLRLSDDAIYVDTTALTIDEVVEKLKSYIAI